MKRIVREISKLGYQTVIKPLMFQREPDNVHRGLLKTAKRVQWLPGVRSLPKLWRHRSRLLHMEVFGRQFENPIGLSAGFDKAVELPKVMKHVGFGWMTGGSVTWGHYAGNEKPWFYRLPADKALVVHAGLPSKGTPVVSERVKGYNEKLFSNFPLVISVAKTNSAATATDESGVKDYCKSLGVFDKLGQVSVLEINISCPNAFGGEPFTTAERLEKLLTAVDELHLKKPVTIKMPIGLSLTAFDALLGVIVQHNVAGVAIGNLLKDRHKVALQSDLPTSVKGGLSGQPTKDISTELIRHTYRHYGRRLIIIGIGGVMSAVDAYEKICAGASLVALITGLIYEGPQLVGEMNAGLEKLLRKDGFSTVLDAVGSGS